MITTIIVALCSILPFLIGLVVLQAFLSKRESKWPGLILPLLSFRSPW